MYLINGVWCLLIIGALSFAARKRGRPSIFGRLVRPQPSPPVSLDPDSAEELEREVLLLLAAGQKVGAVKYVREYTHWGLKESKDYVDALESNRHVGAVASFSAANPAPPAGLPADVQVQVSALAQQGRVVEAIKRVRAATGWGLKEAKDYVDALKSSPYTDAAVAFSTTNPTPPVGITDEVRMQVSAMAQQGRIIEAIKRVRAVTGWGLKEAKDYVDTLR